jgi:enediyne polyketide synthase
MRLRFPFVEKVMRATASSLSPDELDELCKATEEAYKSVFAPMTGDSLAGALSNTIAGRICNKLDLDGGGYVVDGACSSSLIAIYTAASKLSSREADLVIAGGVDMSLDPFELVGFSRTGALSKTDMRVYDRRADGFLPGGEFEIYWNVTSLS